VSINYKEQQHNNEQVRIKTITHQQYMQYRYTYMQITSNEISKPPICDMYKQSNWQYSNDDN